MKADRALDALIAEKVMDWENNWEHPNGHGFPDMWGTMDFTKDGPVRVPNFPNYSTDMEAAWNVVEFLRNVYGHWFHLSEGKPSVSHPAYGKRQSTWLARIGEHEYAEADTAPHAICLAALNTVAVGAPHQDGGRLTEEEA